MQAPYYIFYLRLYQQSVIAYIVLQLFTQEVTQTI